MNVQDAIIGIGDTGGWPWQRLDEQQRRELSAFVAAVLGPPEPNGVRAVEYFERRDRPMIRVTRYAFDRHGKHLIARCPNCGQPNLDRDETSCYHIHYIGGDVRFVREYRCSQCGAETRVEGAAPRNISIAQSVFR